MKGIRYIFLIITILGVQGTLLSQDFTRLSERSIMGTARYVGMSGAMSAIGGDPSSTHDNAAGLGLYRRAEVLLTLGCVHDKAWQVNGKYTDTRTVGMLPQASVVVSIASNNSSDEGVQFNNVMFSYRRLHSYNRTMYGTSDRDRSLGWMLNNYSCPLADINYYCADWLNKTNELLLRESGMVNEFSFKWAINISNRWFVGAGLDIQSYSLSSVAEFMETFGYQNPQGKDYSNYDYSTLLFRGAGCSFSAGLIYRPTGWMRLGFGIQSPSVGAYRGYSTGYLRLQTDTLVIASAKDCTWPEKSFHMPLHTSTSAAFQIGAYALIALQYDYYHARHMDDRHSLRAGVEVIPVMGMYLNAGYAYESTFKNTNKVVPMDQNFNRLDTYFINQKGTQYASFAIGYRGTNMIVQAAYQYRWQRLNLFAHEAAAPYDLRADTHRIVVTIGWHQN